MCLCRLIISNNPVSEKEEGVMAIGPLKPTLGWSRY